MPYQTQKHPGWSALGRVQKLPFFRIEDGFFQQARQQPRAVAVSHGGVQVSYGELASQAVEIAYQLGRVPGTGAVGLFMERSVEMVAAVLGSLVSGCPYVPQDVRISPAERLRAAAELAHCRVVLTNRQHLSYLRRHLSTEVWAVEDLLEGKRGVRLAPSSLMTCESRGLGLGRSQQPAMILFTSGTTGEPNGVPISHSSLVNVLHCGPACDGMGPGKKVAQLMNIAFDMAAWEILGALNHGAQLVLRESGRWQQAASQAHVIVATPTLLSSIDPAACPLVEVVTVAGETCSSALAELWVEYGRFRNSCGPTETTIINSLQEFQRRGPPLSIGRPTPNNSIYVLDQELRPVSVGEKGEIWAGGLGVSCGYLNNPQLTQQRFLEDPFARDGSRMFRCRDVGRWNSYGELEHHGRTDELVKVRGFRVELDGVSRTLERLGFGRTAVTVQASSRYLVSFVEGPGKSLHNAAAELGGHLPYYAVPQQVVGVAKLPRTPRGKVDKSALVAWARQALEGVA